jgi:hypothetical protein
MFTHTDIYIHKNMETYTHTSVLRNKKKVFTCIPEQFLNPPEKPHLNIFCRYTIYTNTYIHTHKQKKNK